MGEIEIIEHMVMWDGRIWRHYAAMRTLLGRGAS